MKERTPSREYQIEDLKKMIPRLFVAQKRHIDWVLLPVLRQGEPIYGAVYSELEFAEYGDLFVMHRDRLLHASFTIMPDALMVKMPADSALTEQPLDYS